MADAVEIEPGLTDNKKATEQEPATSEQESANTIGKNLEEKHEEPTSSGGSRAEEAQTAKEDELKPSKLKELWGKLGLDLITVLMMFKSVLHFEILRA